MISMISFVVEFITREESLVANRSSILMASIRAISGSGSSFPFSSNFIGEGVTG